LADFVHFDNGIALAITINNRPKDDECTWNGMYPLIKAIAENSVAWPDYDLF